MNKLQTKVGEFVKHHQLETTVEHRLLDLLSELGEVAKEVLKNSSYGKKRFQPQEAWEEEMGDLFFSTICLANSTGVDLDKALEKVIAKYRMRLQQKGDAGSS